MIFLTALYFLTVNSCVTTSPIVGNSFVYNGISSYSGFYQAVNTACGGIVGWAVAIMFFAVIFIIVTMYSNIGPGLVAAGGVMTILTVLLQSVGIVGSGMPFLFGGLMVLGIIITVLQGVLDPFR